MSTDNDGPRQAPGDASGGGTGAQRGLNGDRRDPWLRAAALVGATTLPLVLAATMLADPIGPDGNLNPGSSDAELLEMFVESRGRQLVAAALFAAAAAATLVFLGPLWARLRIGSEWLAVVAVAGGTAAGVLGIVIGVVWSITATVAADYNDAAAAQFLMVSGRVGPAVWMNLVVDLGRSSHETD